MPRRKNDEPKMGLNDFNSHREAEAIKRFGKAASDPEIHALGCTLSVFYQSKKPLGKYGVKIFDDEQRKADVEDSERRIMAAISQALHEGDSAFFKHLADFIPICSKNTPVSPVETHLLSLIKYHPESKNREPLMADDPQHKKKNFISETLLSHLPIWPPTIPELLKCLRENMNTTSLDGQKGLDAKTLRDTVKKLPFPTRPAKRGAPKKQRK